MKRKRKPQPRQDEVMCSCDTNIALPYVSRSPPSDAELTSARHRACQGRGLKSGTLLRVGALVSLKKERKLFGGQTCNCNRGDGGSVDGLAGNGSGEDFDLDYRQ